MYGACFAARHDLGKHAEERLAHRAHEGKIRARIIACKLVEEDSAHAAGLTAVRQIEIPVAGLREFAVGIGAVALAGAAQRIVKGCRVPSMGKVGVRSAPPPNQARLVRKKRRFICTAGT